MKLTLNLETLKDVNRGIDALELLRSLYVTAEEAVAQTKTAEPLPPALEPTPVPELEPEPLRLQLTPLVKSQRSRRARKAEDTAKIEAPNEPPAPITEEPKPQTLSEDKLQRLLALAREHGIDWARSALSSFGVKKFSELLDDEATALLRDNEAHAA